MYTLRKIKMVMFIFGISISSGYSVCADHSSGHVQSCGIKSDTDATSYDDFDAMADDMIDMGVAPEEPKPLSTLERWAQQICSPIIMKYVILKGYVREWCYWMVGVKQASDKK